MRKSVADVFTPRNPEVNESMYIHREKHERSFLRALDDGRHLILLGESGNGKTWLYRKVLNGVRRYKVINCALASSQGSLVAAIASILLPELSVRKVAYTEKKAAGVSIPGVANGGLEHVGEYVIRQAEPLMEALSSVSSVNSLPLLIIENLEAIYSVDGMMRELASLILLLDDPRYAGVGLKFLIVGTPSDVIEYFRKLPNLESVSNRLVELPKVSGLSDSQVLEFVRKGFVAQLGVKLDESDVLTIADHVSSITLGVAQRVHEYCKHLAYEIEDNSGNYSSSLLDGANRAWLSEGLRSCYSVVASYFGRGAIVSLRREQVIFSISQIRVHEFDSQQVESTLRRMFPESAKVANLGVGAILRRLCSGDNPLLRINGGGKYRVGDPRYLMCLRIVMKRDRESSKVHKLSFTLT